MDKFKQYLQDNRGGLDTEKFPVEENWEAIRKRLPLQKEKTGLFRWGIAASFLIVVSVGLYAVYQRRPMDSPIAKEVPGEIPSPQVRDTVSNSAEKNMGTSESKSRNRHIAGNKEKTSSEYRRRRRTKQPLSETEQMDIGFQAMINAQLRTIRTTPFYAENPDYFSSFKKEYGILEKEETTLKLEAKHNGMNELYLDQLIDIYQGKLSLLKRLQSEIQRMNNRIRQADPEAEKRNPVYLNI
ncbi:MAG: hypothetical protein J0L54_08245 [Chitinophagales bacterium]|nr:hypothetical protein [Chitinophagales bacterium]